MRNRYRNFTRALAATGLMALLAVVAQAATFHVTTTADNGDNANPTAGSLRKAIKDANASPGLDTIDFNIPGTGVQTISPPAQLPDITDPIIIDGYTQQPCSGNSAPCSQPNTLSSGDNATLLIVLDGGNAGIGAIGLNITGGGSTIKGLVISHFNGVAGSNFARAISLKTGGGNIIAGNFIGTDPAGTTKAPNNVGISVDGSANNTIGGTTPDARNLVSGNDNSGISIVNQGATGNVVQGNFVGTDVNGKAALGNKRVGVSVGQIGTAASNIVIGGTTPGAGNVISGNGDDGIQLFNNLTGALVQGNIIGADVTGKVALGNFNGIFINTTSPNGATIGGTTAAARNIISGNSRGGIGLNTLSSGIVIQGNYIGVDITGNVALGNSSPNFGDSGIFSSADNTVIGGTAAGAGNVISANAGPGIVIGNSHINNQVQGNKIGVGADGVTPLGNGSHGVWIVNNAHDNIIGGSGNAANLIAFNKGSGVNVLTGTNNKISANSIMANTALGIDLNSDGVTQNDQADVDTGPNNLQNFPALTAVTSNGASTTIQGSLNSTAGTQFHIEFFANAQPDSTGFGEGQTFFGMTDVTTDASGDASFTVNIAAVSAGQYLSATATDPAGNTSEFSLSAKINDVSPMLSINDVSLAEGNSGTKNATFAVTLSSAYPLPVTVDYATADGTAQAPSDYAAKNGTLTFAPGQITQTVAITVNGDTTFEPDETFSVNLANATNAAVSKSKGTGTITNDDSAPQTANVQFGQSSFSVNENEHFKQINVTRTGDTAVSVSVDYKSADGTAQQRTDYNIMLGTLHFAPGETSKTLTFLVTDDSYVEGAETLTLLLSNAQGGTLGAQSQAQVTILDNDNDPNATNAIVDAQNFIRQQYHDFLGREPDPIGFQGWQDTLNNCVAGDTKCDRIEVSSAFYRSQEFHDRGYFIYRFYSASLGRTPHYDEFMKDIQKVSGFLSVQQQEQAKVDFISEFMGRSEFTQKYGQSMDAATYVDTLSQTAGVTLSNRNQIVQQLQSSQITRGQALRGVIESPEVDQKFYNEGFVVMQYFGYLRRDPDILYLQWLNTLNQSNDYRMMVNGFINSTEYVLRFGK